MSCFNCIHPVTVKTKRGEVKVPCGRCAACINRKSSIITNQCNIEFQEHKYRFFVTLTYGDNYLPLCRVYKHRDRYVFVDVSSRDCIGDLGHEGTPVMAVAHCTDFSDEFFNMYYEKLNLHEDYKGLIPYLSRRDYQLFLKRLRKFLSFTNERIRYFVCGEYGPKHFRPHFHILLLTNSDAVARSLRKGVYASWNYGRIDFQVAKGGATGYCAKYINSLSHLSAIQRLSSFRPFSAHSRFFARSFFETLEQKIPEITYSDFITGGIAVGSRYKQVVPWLAFENGLFPKCYGYGSADSNVRLFLYTSITRLSKEYGESRVSVLATAMADSVWNGNPSPWVSEFLRIFSNYYDGSKLDSTFSSILYTSIKFLRLCQKFNLSSVHLLRCIENYYKTKEYYGLYNQLKSQEDFISQYGEDFKVFLLCWYSNFEPIYVRDIENYYSDREHILYMLDNPMCDRRFWEKKLYFLDALSPFKKFSRCVLDYINSLDLEPSFITDAVVTDNNPIYHEFVNMQTLIAKGSVKHKELQDKNLIYCYGKYNEYEKC